MVGNVDSQAPVPVLGTVALFVALFTGLTLAVVLLMAATGITLGGWVNFVIVVFAAFGAGKLFIRAHGRQPTDQERKLLIAWSFVAAWLVTIVVLATFMFAAQTIVVGDAPTDAGPFDDIIRTLQVVSPSFVMAVGAVVSVVYLMAIWLGYGPLLRQSGN